MFLCRKLEILQFCLKLSVSRRNIFRSLKKQLSNKLSPFYETHNLLFAKIKLCLFISTHKSLRSKITLSHRFKIFPSCMAQDYNFCKNFLIAHVVCGLTNKLHARNFEPHPWESRGPQPSACFWLLFARRKK